MSELKTSLNECLEKLNAFKISYIEQETGLSRYYISLLLSNDREHIKLSHLDIIIDFLNKHSISEKNIVISPGRKTAQEERLLLNNKDTKSDT